jgi:hypothetical protein
VVTFEKDRYGIAATAGPHGSITDPGTAWVGHGEGKTYTITPGTGYRILDVVVDGVSVGAVGTYGFTDVTGGHWIHATFAPPEIVVMPDSIEFGNVPSGGSSEETVTVMNSGDVALTLSTIGSLSGPFSRTGGSCTNGMVLDPGETCTVEVTFAPTTAGVFTSSFNITSNALDAPTLTVHLEGGSGPDFIGTWTTPVAQVCSSPTKCKLAGVLTVKNVGNQDPLASIYVNFYLSSDGVHYSEPPIKVASAGKLKVGKSKAVKLSVNTTSSSSGKYVIGVIDAGNLVLEGNEENNLAVFGPIP